MELDEAIRQAVITCQKRRYYAAFLTKHARKVVNMLCTEWNLEDALAVEREESLAEGIVTGILRSIKALIKNAGMPIEPAMSLLGVPETEWQRYRGLLETQ